MRKNLALGCLAVSWLFAVPLSYTWYQKSAFKFAAVEGHCRIVNMKLWEEGKGKCDERWSGLTVWDQPCKVDVEVTHEGYNQATDNKGKIDSDNTGVWLHILSYQCSAPGFLSEEAPKGQSCIDLLQTRDNDVFKCSYIPAGEPPHFSVSGNKIYAAEKKDLGASNHLFWMMIFAWVFGPVCTCVSVAQGKASKRGLIHKEEEEEMLDYDDEEDDDVE